MESVHVVGIMVTILIAVYYIVLSNKLDRIEEKLDNMQKQLATQTNEKKKQCIECALNGILSEARIWKKIIL